MVHPLMLLALPAALCGTDPGAVPVTAGEPPVHAAASLWADSLRDVYDAGQRWEPYLEAVDRRRSLWLENWSRATVPEPLKARARAAGGPWRILVITEPGCSDSANSVPYLARLVEEVPSLELRLVNSTAGRTWMEAHRSPDGRAATPTVLVLDEQYRIRGCWIEQPAQLQAFWLPVVARGTTSEQAGEKMAWYAADEGREILREVVEVLEGAHRGQAICPGLG